MKQFEERPEDIKAYCDAGVIPIRGDYKKVMQAGGSFSKGETAALLMGQCAGAVNRVESAELIVKEMVEVAIASLRSNIVRIAPSKL